MIYVMKIKMRKMPAFILGLMIIVMALGSGLQSGVQAHDDENDHEKKRTGFQKVQPKHEQLYENIRRKKIMPFAKVLEKVRPFIKGEIIETEFDTEDGKPVYEFKFITKKGRVREIYVDAKTGELIKKEHD